PRHACSWNIGSKIEMSVIILNPLFRQIGTNKMSRVFIPICMWCKHLDVNDQHFQRCDAFPDGIPHEIRYDGTVLHTEPYEGDNGIRFERRSDDAPMPDILQIILDRGNLSSDTLFRMFRDMTYADVHRNQGWRY